MKSGYRRGLAFVMHEGNWTDTNAEAPTSLVLRAIKAQRNSKNVVGLHRGPASHKLDHIIVVWASPPVIERLSAQVRNGDIGHPAAMDVVLLDPRDQFKDVRLSDFYTAQNRVKAHTHRIRSLPAAKPATTAAPPAPPPTEAQVEPVAAAAAAQAADDKGLPGPAPAQAEIIDLNAGQSAAPPATATAPATAADTPPAADAQTTETPSLAMTGT